MLQVYKAMQSATATNFLTVALAAVLQLPWGDIVRTADSCLIETILEAETAALASAGISVSYAQILAIMQNDP